MIEPSWAQTKLAGLGVTRVPVHEVDVETVVDVELCPGEHVVRPLELKVLENTRPDDW